MSTLRANYAFYTVRTEIAAVCIFGSCGGGSGIEAEFLAVEAFCVVGEGFGVCGGDDGVVFKGAFIVEIVF